MDALHASRAAVKELQRSQACKHDKFKRSQVGRTLNHRAPSGRRGNAVLQTATAIGPTDVFRASGTG
jgi:hypothetical protein